MKNNSFLKIIIGLLAILAVGVAFFSPKESMTTEAFLTGYSAMNVKIENTPKISSQVRSVVLSEFSAIFDKGGVLLEWEAENEFELVGFQVERSIGGAPFEKVGWVHSRELAREIYYEFYDRNVIMNGDYLYRLKMVEMDGGMYYSQAITAKKSLF